MGFDSYLEIFTTVYGWTIANLIYSILLDTGIVFIPLIVTIIAVWLQAHEDGTENGSAQWAIRKMEVELVSALFVMSVCFVPTPFTTLDKAHLSFKPDGTVATPSPVTVTGNGSSTTYDRAFGTSVGGSIPVPMWWYMVMGLSSGVNSAIRAGVSNSSLGLRQAEELARLATIESPALRGEAQMFHNQCFMPAHAKFHSADTTHSPIATEVLNDRLYGKDDTEWIGSKVFRQAPEYYASFRAQQVVAGFEMDRDGDDKDASPSDIGSMPNCKRWWEDSQAGLRARLVSQSGTALQRASDQAWGIASATNTGLTTINPAGFTADYVKDQMLKQALWRSQANFVQTDQVLGGQNASRWSLPEFLSGIGIAMKGFEASFSYYPIVQFVTLAQPLILMGLYIFLPFIVLFSRFSLSFMMYGALAIFTVKFWAAMWAIAKFVDERLVVAMYGDTTILVREYFTNGLDGGAKRVILNVLTLSLVLVLPMLWSGMMAWVGVKVGLGVSEAIKSAYQSGGQAGAATTSTVGSAVRNVASRLARR